ncbi:MAG: glycosyltransferase, partial [Phycisphaerae bacterium]
VVVPGQYSVLVMRQYGRWRYREAFENDDDIPTYSSYTCAWFPLVPYANTHSWLKHGMRLFERYLREVGRPDLIQAQAAFQAGILAERIKRRYGIPYVLSEHSSMFLEGRVSFWQMPLVRRAWAEADARTVVSPKLGEATERYFGAVAGGWTWLPNMVERQFFEMPLRPARGRSREFRFLHLAHFTSTKNQPDLIRAFAGRFRGEVDVVLRIGGDGASRPALEALAARLGIRNQVRFLGMLSRDRALQEMLAADTFVLSSHFETFSIVLAEALACGTPVVSTACGGPECIVNDTNGLLVPPGDVRALGQAMAAVRERAGWYDAEAIRRDCARRFSQEVVVAKWTQIYETVLARSGAAGRRAV